MITRAGENSNKSNNSIKFIVVFELNLLSRNRMCVDPICGGIVAKAVDVSIVENPLKDHWNGYCEIRQRSKEEMLELREQMRKANRCCSRP